MKLEDNRLSKQDNVNETTDIDINEDIKETFKGIYIADSEYSINKLTSTSSTLSFGTKYTYFVCFNKQIKF
ncbi:hypothetical protein HERIO_999 [Hepatospora eriocheir]|uniref:Uncharacterized protein n=1 Tax=Hepatospora eriocheir TaxID=1081669 RepID=A0A1X0QBN5_9MICR|nr:hypothetical protein HERIO_999 [Hepatospora eriocheir]